MKALDRYLNSVTMYRLVQRVLLIDLIYAVVVGFVGWIPFSAVEILTSAGVIYLVCVFSNDLLSRLLSVQKNLESTTITALILALVLAPARSVDELIPLIIGSVLAMLSKYIFAFGKKHIFNPAAVSMVLLNLFGLGVVWWWVGSSAMLPVTLFTGIAIVRKLRREHLFFSFLFSAFIANIYNSTQYQMEFMDSMKGMIFSWPIIFFGTVMLTEPITSPPKKFQQIIYGSIVGLLFGFSYTLGPLYSSPELALVLGNIYSYLLSFKFRLHLTLKTKSEIVPGVMEYVFTPDKKIEFEEGQYLEWTLEHRNPDSRGFRRYFTIASDCSDPDISLIFRYESAGSSSFKTALLGMKAGEKIVAGNLSGDFTLPNNLDEKLVFIAGGIGITPFISMIRRVVRKKEKRTITLIYICKTEDDLILRKLLSDAKKAGIKVACVLTDLGKLPRDWKEYSGKVSTTSLVEIVPDFRDRSFYISGPSEFVESLKKTVLGLNVPQSKVHTDYFPGY